MLHVPPFLNDVKKLIYLEGGKDLSKLKEVWKI